MLFLILAVSGCTASHSTLNPASSSAGKVANLSWLLFGIAAMTFTVVTLILAYVIFRNRNDRLHTISEDVNSPETPEQAAENEKRALRVVMVAGGLVPAVVLAMLMALAIVIEQGSAIASASSDTLTIQVIGHQWWWEVHYPDQGINSANEIHIPAGEPVIFRLTSDDVIHSFWIPQLGGKLDLIPGQTNTIQLQADEPGIYRGQCAEFCGLQHANMAFFVIASERDDFETWVNTQEQPAQEPEISSIEAGRQVFMGSACVYCHRIEGTNATGVIGPDLTHLASRATIGAGVLPNTRGNLAAWITNAQAIKPGNRMPPMQLDPDQLQTLLDYLETLQ
ncbi:cytochrome c oxidase subunit II [Phototrophicus methaneseepsis]|uniref:cytochrome-c oxidase n=2 Tax=Phototrophicus methaneseepsis TaxID=2710758 RepID=A0A7S8EEB4_9CHLR|nr:cytochrome c oxidase subunit II [Phototrophicus methaneseepsis]